MGKKEDVKDIIWEIWEISINAKRFLKYSFYLHKPDTKEELEYLRTSRDFQFIAQALWQNAVIELSKLFSNSKNRDKFNIFHFIKKLEKNGHFSGFEISQNKINNWYTNIEESRETINLIIKLRDKVYAHTDGYLEKKGLDTPTFEQTLKLIDIVESVIEEIHSSIFDTQAMMNSRHLEFNPSKILKILAREREIRISARKGLLKKL
tara:strand:+ start:1395 stop:2015 length:621 start_codon:yes stop_codon:yes gene_type:complete